MLCGFLVGFSWAPCGANHHFLELPDLPFAEGEQGLGQLEGPVVVFTQQLELLQILESSGAQAKGDQEARVAGDVVGVN